MKFCPTVLKVFLPSLSLFVSSFIFSTPAQASVSEIYSSPNYVSNLRMKDGHLTWIEDNKVKVHNINTGTTTLIDRQVSSLFADNSGQKVVFGDAEGYNTGLYTTYGFAIYDLSTDTLTRVNNHSMLYSTPKIEGTKVFWGSFTDENGEQEHSLYMYDMTTQAITHIGDTWGSWGIPHHADNLQINQGKVLYMCKVTEEQGGFCLYDIATGVTTTVYAGGGFYPTSPQQIDDGKVVYVTNDPETEVGQVYMYTIATDTTTRITNSPAYKLMPRIHNGKIAWGEAEIYDSENPENSIDSEVYLYDIATGISTNITNNNLNDVYNDEKSKLFLKDGRVSWAYWQPGAGAIPVYDITAGTLNYLSSDPDNNTDLNLDGNKVAWVHYDGTNYEILLSDGAPSLPVTVTYTPTDDTYVKSGSDNRNIGAGTFMRLQSSGDNRSLVRFDHAAMQSEIGASEVLEAKLRVTITDNGNNWGNTGRTIDLHRMIANWSEGNGTEADRGTGAGATWACAIDANIANQAKNCSGNTEWEMGQPNNPSVHPWIQTATDTETITNNQTGVVEFDVTADVASFLNGTNTDYGWLLKKTNEGQNGQVSFGTKESATDPELVITYQP